MKKLIRNIISWATPSIAQDKVGICESTTWASGPQSYPVAKNSANITKSSSGPNFPPGMNFIIHPANGGKIIQCSYYDDSTDRVSNNLYVIHDTDDLATEMAMIITKENLRR